VPNYHSLNFNSAQSPFVIELISLYLNVSFAVLKSMDQLFNGPSHIFVLNSDVIIFFSLLYKWKVLTKRHLFTKHTNL